LFGNPAHTAATGFVRLALAACLLALVALAVAGVGAGPGGALGSLFGFAGDGAKRNGPAARPIARGPVDGPALPAAARQLVTRHVNARHRPLRVHRAPERRPAGQQAPQRTPASPKPVVPAPPAPAPPLPQPAPPGVVGGATETIKRTAQPLPAPAQPIVGQAVETVTQICGVLGGCP